MEQFIKDAFEAIESVLHLKMDDEDVENLGTLLRNHHSEGNITLAGEIVDYYDMPRRFNRSALATKLRELKAKHEI